MAHSPISPSFLERAFKCTSCAVKHLKFAFDDDNKFSKLGTVAHGYLETCLSTKTDPRKMSFKGDDNDDMKNAVTMAYDYASALPNCSYERRVYLFPQDTIEGQMCHGTADIISDNFPKCLEVVDYKHGEFSFVDVHENEQLMGYALGASEGREYETYRITIIQPRHRNGGISSWEFSHTQLTAFKERLSSRLKELHTAYHTGEVGECELSETCKYSPFKIESKAVKDILNFAEKRPYQIDQSKAEEILLKKESLERLINDCERFMINHLSAGGKAVTEDREWKLKQGYTNRRWAVDQEALLEEFGDEIKETKVMTASQAIKKLGERVEEYIIREPSTMRLVYKKISTIDFSDDDD
jgi:hypothetical protein